jgi:hypothetical protein
MTIFLEEGYAHTPQVVAEPDVVANAAALRLTLR